MNDDATADGESELCRPESAAEAGGIEAVLKAEGIDCQVTQLGVTPYPTVDNLDAHWGVVRVAPEDLEQARTVLAAWRSATPENLEKAWQEAGPRKTRPPPRSIPSGLVVLLVIILLLFLAVALLDPSALSLPDSVGG